MKTNGRTSEKISILGSRLRPSPSITTILRITLLKDPSCFTRWRTIAENNSDTTVLTFTCKGSNNRSEKVVAPFLRDYSTYCSIYTYSILFTTLLPIFNQIYIIIIFLFSNIYLSFFLFLSYIRSRIIVVTKLNTKMWYCLILNDLKI